MPGICLNTNIMSLQTQRRLSDSTASLTKSYERLSSGLRVSKASDDAAGLAIASGLSADSRVFSQGLRNLNDGVSLANIAEGALNQLTNIVTRLQELAEQASNGTLGSKQRAALDAEAQALSKEYFRVSQTTTFNGQKLFDGSVQGLNLQVGYGSNGALQTSLAGKLGTGNFGNAANYGTNVHPESIALGDLNGDGKLDLVASNRSSSTVSILLANGDGTFNNKTDYSIGGTPKPVALADLNGDGVLDIVSVRTDGTGSTLLGNGDGTFQSKVDFTAGTTSVAVAVGDLNNDGIPDIVTANQGADTASVLLGNGDGTFKAKTDFGTGSQPQAITLGDVNGDNILDIVAANRGDDTISVLTGKGGGTFNTKTNFTTGTTPFSVKLGDLNGDGLLDVVTTNIGTNNASVLLGNGNGTYKAKTDYGTGSTPTSVALGDLNGDGTLDIIAGNQGSGSVSVLLGNGNGTFQSKSDNAAGTTTTSVAVGDFNGDGVLDIASANYGSNNASVMLAQTRDGVSPLLDFSLKTKSDAKWALELMKQKLSQLSQQRGIIGANQSRLSTAAATLMAARENYDAARSQITDVDVATESAQLTRNDILQQAAAAVLSQANQEPALALKLLR